MSIQQLEARMGEGAKRFAVQIAEFIVREQRRMNEYERLYQEWDERDPVFDNIGRSVIVAASVLVIVVVAVQLVRHFNGGQ